MKCGPGFKTNIGFKQHRRGLKKVLKPNSATWQHYRRKEDGAAYGTVTFEATRAVLYTPKVNASYSFNQVGIVSKEKIHFGAYNKLKLTYISTSTNETGLTMVVFCADKMINNIPDNSSNTVAPMDLDNLTVQSAIVKNIAYLGLVGVATVVEYDISNIKTENYLYIHNRYVNNNQAGNSYLYIYDVELS